MRLWFSQEIIKGLPTTSAKEVVYGQTALLREDIKKVRLVANPGCYPTLVQLPLILLIKVYLISFSEF
ncbi:unnamed protein product [Thlaspi arvense]|uniref:Uncharacterized protein n=1 Tax=Thlaspi arvense TaxID=13288 RepID=A0AAU9SID6_THLAR|nr:unnamed protein product [Thlaspi arvense]